MDEKLERYIRLLREHISATCEGMTRKAQGALGYPYIVPSSPDSPYYSDTLWDWDSYFAGITFAQLEADSGCPGRFSEYEKGSVLNFFAFCGEDGSMPICVTPRGDALKIPGREEDRPGNMHKPVLAQQIASILKRNVRDTGWIRQILPKLEAFENRYLTQYRHEETGLLYWKDDLAVGVDNEPSVFFRPENSSGSIYLNSLMIRELKAMGYLMEMLGDVKAANLWRLRAEELIYAVKRHCWDERDGTYYSVDLNLLPVVKGQWLHSGAPRDYPCLIMRLDSWTSFLPMWAGACSREQAERMVLRLKEERSFNCRAGVRTLSPLEKMYDLRASNNPSNWRGPVWGVSNFLVFSGLVKYGFDEEARALAEKTVLLFGRDLEQNGCLHEYYHPDSCEPIVTHGFENWNYLVLNMIAWLENRPFVDTF